MDSPKISKKNKKEKNEKNHEKRNKSSIKLLSAAELEEIAAVKQAKSRLKVWHQTEQNGALCFLRQTKLI